MQELFERAKHGAAALRGRSAALREKLRVRKSNPQSTQPGGAEPKPPLPLPQCFMLSHLEEDGPVRRDGVKVGVCEVMGLELDEPKLGAFAGVLNALDFPAQLLVRQHPPRLERLRSDLRAAQPPDLPPQTRAAAQSLRRLLSDLETRDGILDRRSTHLRVRARRRPARAAGAVWAVGASPPGPSATDVPHGRGHRSPHAVWCWEAGKMKPSHEHLLELAYRCEVSTDWILGRDVVEAELLKEADVSFSNAVSGLPTEDVESIMEFIRFVRERRRRT